MKIEKIESNGNEWTKIEEMESNGRKEIDLLAP